MIGILAEYLKQLLGKIYEATRILLKVINRRVDITQTQ